MKPGICALCGKSCVVEEIAFNKGSYVKFSDYKKVESFSLDYPTGVEFFCDEHVTAAKALTTFTTKEAIVALKKQFGVIPEYKPPRRIGLLKRIFSSIKRS